MLRHHKLLIDQDCPMCQAYGQCFVKFNLVDDQTIAPYQTIEAQYADQINMTRARNEIALFDQESNQTVYGYDALSSVIAQQSIMAKNILNFAPIKWIFTQLYFFVSYNRKVIVPARPRLAVRSCVPDEQPVYRWLYILFVALSTGYILNQFVHILSDAIDQPFSPYREYFVCIGQVIWQGVAINIISPQKRLEYLGNMSTVSMISGLLLIPVLLLNYIIILPVSLLVITFFAVVLFMLYEHVRRCKLLAVPLTMTYSWVMFRVTVLITIILITL